MCSYTRAGPLNSHFTRQPIHHHETQIMDLSVHNFPGLADQPMILLRSPIANCRLAISICPRGFSTRQEMYLRNASIQSAIAHLNRTLLIPSWPGFLFFVFLPLPCRYFRLRGCSPSSTGATSTLPSTRPTWCNHNVPGGGQNFDVRPTDVGYVRRHNAEVLENVNIKDSRDFTRLATDRNLAKDLF